MPDPSRLETEAVEAAAANVRRLEQWEHRVKIMVVILSFVLGVVLLSDVTCR